MAEQPGWLLDLAARIAREDAEDCPTSARPGRKNIRAYDGFADTGVIERKRTVMIAGQKTIDDVLHLSRAVSGHGVHEVTITESREGVVLRVAGRLDSQHGDGWAEAALGADDLAALRDWINQRLGDEKGRARRSATLSL